jgi:hypothetical protein
MEPTQTAFVLCNKWNIKSTAAISLTVNKAAEALDFYANGFGAEELFRMPMAASRTPSS